MDQHVTRLLSVQLKDRAENGDFSARGLFLIFLVLALTSSTVFLGCSREQPADHVSASHPSGSLSPLSLIRRAVVEPDPVLRDAPVEVAVEVDQSRSDELTYEYQWYINRVAVHEATDTVFDPTSLRRGDVVQVEIIGINETGQRASIRTPAVTVANAPPIVENVVLEQDPPRRRLLARVQASDADDDDIHFVFRWLQNGKLASEGTKDVFDTTGLAQNDVVTVEVVPHDHDGPGDPVRAAPLVGSNNAPSILSHPKVMANAELYEYAVEAKDPEGDAVLFELETGPTGMAIDKTSGRVIWKVPPALTGTHHVKIVAADAKGARTWQEFDLAIPATIEAKTPPPPNG
jgi:hypothetical protein